TPEPGQLRLQLGTLGEISTWSDAPIDSAGTSRLAASGPRQARAMQLVTDGAGSLTRELAGHNGIALLDAYIVAGGVSRPESLCLPEEVYGPMRAGARVTTAQASIRQRHQQYEALCSQYEQTLYLCVGSAFTGNYDTVMAWKKENDPDDRLVVLDTGAASGRLGLIALLTARYAEQGGSGPEIVAFARQCIDDCREFVFIDELKYLVAGGRVSKAGGFFGDLLHLKPVISTGREGVRRVGVVRSRRGQLDFALEKLAELYGQADPVLLLQYSDNKEWVTGTVRPQILKKMPGAEIFCLPLSLTSGVHMGPGTWAVACAPAD
ncbi:MAG TPA: DegV family EDD domain-containing protein, partial [Desulfobulbus sp.]|nr:DegV family EDD domain-containing protein [Desulfobulbus sp.]